MSPHVLLQRQDIGYFSYLIIANLEIEQDSFWVVPKHLPSHYVIRIYTLTMDDCNVQSFSARINLTSAQNLSILIGNSITGPVILVLNLILIICLAKTKQLRKAHGVLLLLLSISDCLIGFLAIPLHILIFSVFKTYPVCTLEFTPHAVGYFTAHFSGYMIAVISFQRNVHINPHIQPQNGFSRLLAKKTGLTILVLVTLLVTSAETLVSVTLHDKFIPRLVLKIIDSVIIIYVYVTYFWMCFKVWRFSKRNTAKQIRNRVSTKTSEDRLATTVALILIYTALCYFPYNILIGVRYKRQRNGEKISIDMQFVIYLTLTVLQFNSAINAAIVMWRSTKIRKYLISLFKRQADRES